MNGTKLEGIIGHFGITSVLGELEYLILQGKEKSNAISFKAADFFRVIDKVKEELKAIEETSPSKAMDRLDYIEYKLGDLRFECERMKSHRCDDLFIQKHIFTTIKQALLKGEEFEKENLELKKKIDSYERSIELYSSKQLEIDNFYLRNENVEYRQLDDQIGCPLEVLGKVILQNCFYDSYGNIIETNIGYINQEGTTGIVMSVKEWEMGNTILLSDHKKTWWLKEDRSE